MTRSTTGRIATIIFIFPAIILNTITYIHCGKIVLCAIKLTLLWFENSILKRKTVKYFQRKHIAILLILTVASIVAFGLLISEYLKHLTTLEIVYWLITTVTTIGFGDVRYDSISLVEHEYWPVILLFQMLCFLLVFAMVASCITAIAEAYSNEKKRKESIKNNDNNKNNKNNNYNNKYTNNNNNYMY